MPSLENFGQKENLVFVMASLNLLKDIESLENNWKRENSFHCAPMPACRPPTSPVHLEGEPRTHAIISLSPSQHRRKLPFSPSHSASIRHRRCTCSTAVRFDLAPQLPTGHHQSSHVDAPSATGQLLRTFLREPIQGAPTEVQLLPHRCLLEFCRCTVLLTHPSIATDNPYTEPSLVPLLTRRVSPWSHRFGELLPHRHPKMGSPQCGHLPDSMPHLAVPPLTGSNAIAAGSA
jgi:hypothetical protein